LITARLSVSAFHCGKSEASSSLTIRVPVPAGYIDPSARKERAPQDDYGQLTSAFGLYDIFNTNTKGCEGDQACESQRAHSAPQRPGLAKAARPGHPTRFHHEFGRLWHNESRKYRFSEQRTDCGGFLRYGL